MTSCSPHLWTPIPAYWTSKFEAEQYPIPFQCRLEGRGNEYYWSDSIVFFVGCLFCWYWVAMFLPSKRLCSVNTYAVHECRVDTLLSCGTDIYAYEEGDNKVSSILYLVSCIPNILGHPDNYRRPLGLQD